MELNINFTPFPELETSRLLLRRVNIGDAEEVFQLRSNPETMKYVPRPLAETIDDALHHINLFDAKIIANEGINWAISLKNSPDLIGIIGLFRIMPDHFRSELGYMLLPEFQGNGFLTEAVFKVLEYGFEVMNLHSVEAIIDPENIASARVLEKNDFVREAHLKENEFFDGKFLDNVIYSKLNPKH